MPLPRTEIERLASVLNPMMGMIEGFRWCAASKSTLHVVALPISLRATLFLSWHGLRMFRAAEKIFADVVSAIPDSINSIGPGNRDVVCCMSAIEPCLTDIKAFT